MKERVAGQGFVWKAAVLGMSCLLGFRGCAGDDDTTQFQRQSLEQRAAGCYIWQCWRVFLQGPQEGRWELWWHSGKQ